MDKEFSRYDTADYLKADTDIIAYLEACAEENDPALMAHALGTISNSQCGAHGVCYQSPRSPIRWPAEL